MIKKLFTPRFIFIISVIFVGAMFRLLPHWPNFTPIAAIALFGGTYINKKSLAFAIPIFAMLIADVFLGFHSYMLSIYLSFAIIVMIGFILRNRVKFGSVLIATVSGSVIFFLITNFAVWLGSPYYAQSFAGLIACYTAGLPFFNSGIIGDLFYSGVFFGGFYFVQLRFPSLARVKS